MMEDRYDDYSGVETFRGVPIGCTFEFDSDLTHGTRYYKVSERKYRSWDNEWDRTEWKVGFIHVGVKNVRRGLV